MSIKWNVCLEQKRGCDIPELLKTGLNKEQSIFRKILSPLQLISDLVLEVVCEPVVK